MIKPRKKYRRRFLVVGRKPIEEYSVVITSGGNGSVTVDGVTGDYVATVPDGTVLTVSATADAHYGFTAWSDGETDNPRTITVTGDLNLTASFAIDTYIVNVIAGSNGSVSVNGTVGNYSQLVAYGTQLEIAATPAMGYDFTAWSDGVSSASRTVTVTGDVTLSAAFAIQTFTVSISAGANGSVSVNGTPGDYLQTVNYGTALVLEATPSTGYDFTMWSDGDGNSQRIIAVTGDVTLSAAFAIQTFSVSISAGSNGSVSVNGTPGDYSQTVSYGTQLTVEAVPSTGYNFTAWSDGNTDNPRTVTVTSDITLSSAYAIQTFSVSVSAGNNGSVSVNGVSGDYSATVNYGTVLTIEATADSHYGFTAWSDGVSTNPRTLTVTSNTNLSAAFAIDTYSVSVTAGNNGSVSVNGTPGDYSQTVPYGTQLTIEAIPSTGYSFDEWSDGNTDNPRTVTITGNTTISSAYTIQTFTVTLSAGANGSISVNGTPVVGTYTDTVNYGTQLTIEATPDSHYSFTQWSDGVSTNPRTLTVTSNTTMSAAFAIDTYNVSLSAGANGSISVNGTPVVGTYTDTVSYGTTLTLAATGDAGYSFDQWSDGDSTNPRTLTVTSDVTLTASFQAAVQPADEIWYTSTDGQVVTPYSPTAFGGATITSNTYSGGKGVIKFNQAVTEVGNNAFKNCSTLETVSMADGSITSIGQSAFSGCSGLTTVTIGSSVTTIGGSAFSYCSGLTTANYTGTIAQWCDIIFTNSSSNPAYYSHNLYINGTEVTQLVIPNGVTEIKKYAFYGCSRMTSATIPNSVTSIGQSAFNGCSGLTTVTIGSSVTSIGQGAFYHCSGITSVTIPNSVTSIGVIAFDGCIGLNSITFTSTTTVPTLGTNAFNNVASTGTVYGQAGLDYSTVMAALPVGWSLVQPYSVTLSAGANGSISVNGTPVVGTYTDTVSSGTQLTLAATGDAGYTFTQWSDGDSTNPRALTVTSDVTLTASFQAAVQPADEIWYTSTDGQVVTPYSPTAFGGATITSNTYSGGKGVIKFNQTLTTVGNNAFHYCLTLASVSLSDSVTTLGYNAFENTGLTSFTLPSGVTSIDFSLFGSCNSLVSITVHANNTNFDNRNNCNAIVETATNKLVAGCKNTVVPNTVTSFGRGAFSGLTTISTFTIPDSVATVGVEAFSNCTNLASVTFGSGVTTVDDYSFNNCTSLTSITFNSTTTVPTIGSGAFNNVASVGTVYGQAGLDYSTVMAALPVGWSLVLPVQPADEIWYKTNNSQTITPYHLKDVNDNNLTVVSNTYSGGIGVVKMSDDIYGTSNSFASETTLTSIMFPSTMTSLGHGCCANCQNLTSVSMPDSITSIGNTCFGNTIISTVTLPSSLTTIGDSAFENTNISSISIPTGVVSIGNYCFKDCSLLNSITFESTTIVPTFQSWTFNSVASVGTVYGQAGLDYSTVMAALPVGWSLVQPQVGQPADEIWYTSDMDTVENPDPTAFLPATITSNTYSGGKGVIKFSQNLTDIGDDAFSSCSLTSISIPSLVTSIGDFAFEDCSSLSSITFQSPTTVPTMGFNPFYDVASTGTVYGQPGLIYFPYIDNDDSLNYWSLVRVQPNDEIWYTSSNGQVVTPYDANAFSPATISSNTYSNGKGVIKFDQDITTVGYFAFRECSTLTSITLPNSVTSIGGGAFDRCSGLTSFVFNESIASVGAFVFSGCDNLSTLIFDNPTTAPTLESYALHGLGYNNGDVYGRDLADYNDVLMQLEYNWNLNQ